MAFGCPFVIAENLNLGRAWAGHDVAHCIHSTIDEIGDKRGISIFPFQSKVVQRQWSWMHTPFLSIYISQTVEAYTITHTRTRTRERYAFIKIRQNSFLFQDVHWVRSSDCIGQPQPTRSNLLLGICLLWTWKGWSHSMTSSPVPNPMNGKQRRILPNWGVRFEVCVLCRL